MRKKKARIVSFFEREKRKKQINSSTLLSLTLFVAVDVSGERNDQNTLISLLGQMEERLRARYQDVTAESVRRNDTLFSACFRKLQSHACNHIFQGRLPLEKWGCLKMNEATPKMNIYLKVIVGNGLRAVPYCVFWGIIPE